MHLFKMQINSLIALYCLFQGLNPGLAIGEMKKMMAKYDANKAKAKVDAEAH